MNLLLTLSLVLSQLFAVNAMYANATLGSCPSQATCYNNGVEGVCVSVSAGCCSGTTTTANLCPGSNDILCCTNNHCSSSLGSGVCMQTSLCAQQGGKSDSGNYCIGPADLQCCVHGTTGKITRDEIMSRAQNWVDRRIPYSQTQTTDGYRQDCSGYVSMAWKSSTAGGGHTTRDMQVFNHCCFFPLLSCDFTFFCLF